MPASVASGEEDEYEPGSNFSVDIDELQNHGTQISSLASPALKANFKCQASMPVT